MTPLGRGLQAAADAIIAGDRAPRGVILAVSPGADDVASDAATTAAAGVARDDGTPLTVDHRFHIASVGKMCTAAMVLQASERGSFPRGVDTTLAQLGTAGLLHSHLATHVHPRPDLVTLRHLLTHTSGMKDMQSDDATGTAADFGGMPAPASIQRRFWDDAIATAKGMDGDGAARHHWVGWDPARSDDPRAGLLNLFVAEGTAATPLAMPGERFHYSDTAYTLLATIVEAVNGLPYHEVQRRDVLAPLGMSATYQAYVDDPGPDARAAEMDVWGGSVALLSLGFDLSFDWGGGGQVSTVRDLCRLVRGFTSGDLFGSPATLAEATAWVAPPGLTSPRAGIGLGLHRWLVDGRELVGHSGAWGVRAFIDPATGVVVTSTVGRRDDCPWYPHLFDLPFSEEQ